MRKRLMVIAAVFLISFIVLSPVLGETFRFKTTRATTINGLDLKPGNYELKLDPTKSWVRLYNKGKFVSVLGVRMEALGPAQPNTVMIGTGGNLAEYRTESHRILFATNKSETLPSATSR